MHTAYATMDTTIIHHVCKPEFSSLRSYFLDRKLGPVSHQIGGRVRSRFILGQWALLCYKLQLIKPFKMYRKWLVNERLMNVFSRNDFNYCELNSIRRNFDDWYCPKSDKTQRSVLGFNTSMFCHVWINYRWNDTILRHCNQRNIYLH